MGSSWRPDHGGVHNRGMHRSAFPDGELRFLVHINHNRSTMNDTGNHNRNSKYADPASIRTGFYSAVLTAALTLITFGFALTAVPISGAFCPDNCIEYPYLNTASQYPGDYLWMLFAMLMILAYMVLMVSIHATVSRDKHIFSLAGLAFATTATVILLSDYFIQFSVIPVSLTYGETDGIPLLIQYNAHGIFIALEDLGYLVMGLSFLSMAPVFSGKNRLETAIRWIFLISFLLALISLIWISARYGTDRRDRLEVAVLSIDWMVLIINGILLSRWFRRRLKRGTAERMDGS